MLIGNSEQVYLGEDESGHFSMIVITQGRRRMTDLFRDVDGGAKQAYLVEDKSRTFSLIVITQERRRTKHLIRDFDWQL